MSEENAIKTTIEAVKGITESIPIYQDMLQPAAQELGKDLEIIAKTVKIALTPLSLMVWGYDKISDYLDRRVPELLKKVSQDKIITPNPSVVGPALDSLRFSAHEDDLREMYAKLIATAMNKDTAKKAHPAFVETIKQLCPDEAKIVQYLAGKRFYPQPVVTLIAKLGKPHFPNEGYLVLRRNVTLLAEKAGCTCIELSSAYLDNLCRLGIIEVIDSKLNDHLYEELEESPIVKDHLTQRIVSGTEHLLLRGSIRFTDFGQQFVETCVVNSEKLELEME